MAQQNIFSMYGHDAIRDIRSLFQVSPQPKNTYQKQSPMKLQNQAMGVSSRRSQAFQTGKTRGGANQFGRGMRIKALNI